MCKKIKQVWIFSILAAIAFAVCVNAGCGKVKDGTPDYTGDTGARVSDSKQIEITEESKVADYVSITMEEAKKIFEVPGDYIILDVRRADEFASGHIPGAINVANEDIADTPLAELPDMNQTIYVYCRSGNRSKQASVKLAAMGYKNIIEFGGIIDWSGDVVR